MQTSSVQPVAVLSWACVIGALGLSLMAPGYGGATIVAACGLGVVCWRYPPGKPTGSVRPGDLLWHTEGLGPAWAAERLRPGLVRDLESLHNMAPTSAPLSPHLQATEVALRAMHRGGIVEPRSLSDRDVIALALLRDAIVSEPAKAARLASSFRDPAAVLDLRDRVRGGDVFAVRSPRVA